MSSVIDVYPKTCATGIFLSIGATPASLLLGCSKPIIMAVGGISFYGATVGTFLSQFPANKTSRMRVVQIVAGAAAAGGLFYKITTDLLPTNPNDSQTASALFACVGSIAASLTLPFAQELYHFGKNAVLGNRAQLDSSLLLLPPSVNVQ